MAGDGVFDLGFALGNLVGDGLKQGLTMFGVQQDYGYSLVVVHFGMILEYPSIVAQDYACDARQLAVACPLPIFRIGLKYTRSGF